MKVILRSWADVKAYISHLGYSHPFLQTQDDGRGMVLKYADRRLDREASTNRYPLLEIEPPRYQIEIDRRGGRRGKRYTITMAVLSSVGLDDYTGQEWVHEALEPVMDQLVGKMKHDGVLSGEKWDVYPVSNESHDNMWGWAVTVSLLVDEGYCYHLGEWYDLRRLRPIWTPGQTELSVIVNGASFSVPWTENTDAAMLLAVQQLAALISASESSGTGAFDSSFFDPSFFDTGDVGADSHAAGDPDHAHLVVIGKELGGIIIVTPGQGHAWNIETSTWL